MSPSPVTKSLALSALLVTLAIPSVPAQSPPAPAAAPAAARTSFTRVVETESGEVVRFQTAIVTYVDDRGRSVDLVAAVHIGDGAYFRALQKEFEAYDVLLYEMVKPQGAVVTPGQGSSNPLSMLQRLAQKMLEVEYQLDVIDYTKENFVHADMTAEEFADALQGNLLEMIFDLVLETLADIENGGATPPGAAPPEMSLKGLMELLFSPDRARRMKSMLARQFGDIEAVIAGFGKGPMGELILSRRNDAAVRVLDRELAKGHDELGLYYGAAHMPDLEIRLAKRGFKPSRTRWVTAWDLGEPPPAAAPGERAPAPAAAPAPAPKPAPKKKRI